MQYNRSTMEQRVSDNISKRDIPSFIEPRPPLIPHRFMRPKSVKGTNLLEQFEEDSDLVQVYLRLKPCKTPSNLYEVRSDQYLITSTDTASDGHGRQTQHNVSKMYKFTKIFGPETTQKEIFETTVKENLQKLPEGHNYTLLTYGASGSGKTYTLMGTVACPGLVPRSLEYLFKIVEAAQQPLCRPFEGRAEKLSASEQQHELQWVKKLRHISAPLRDKYRRMSVQLSSDFNSTVDLANRTRYYVWVSFVEIYNEMVYDLLVPGERRSKLRIREDPSGAVYVQGATQAFVRSGSEAYDVLVAGKHNLQIAATGVHAHSSRSHCIFTITMLTETESGTRVSTVRLCDLAGSERAVRTHNTGARMQESRAINSSLHVLERCLHMLRRKQKQGLSSNIVPYRESKLTRLLGAGLSGASGEAVTMLVTVTPEPACALETRHVLQLAAVARDIQLNATMAETTEYFDSSARDTTVGSNYEVMKLRADNERLLFELVQAQAHNKELLSSMEENQQKAASIQRELVDEARDITREYYEAQLRAMDKRHREEIEDLTEEYESKLSASSPTGKSGTPTRKLQDTITQLRTKITIMEEKLNVERLAREMAEAEVQHLRGCIEERDLEKSNEENPPEKDKPQVHLSDGEQESDDELNQSLEPSFRVDRGTAVIADDEDDPNTSMDERTDCEIVELGNDTTLENSRNSLKEPSEDRIDEEDNNYDTANKSDEKVDDINSDNDTCDKSIHKHGFENDKNHETLSDRSKKILHSKRGTYAVNDATLGDTKDSGCNTPESNRESMEAETINVSLDGKLIGNVSKGLLNRLKQFSGDSEKSLELFEQLEAESEGCSYQRVTQEKNTVSKETERSKEQSSDGDVAMFERSKKKLQEKGSNEIIQLPEEVVLNDVEFNSQKNECEGNSETAKGEQIEDRKIIYYETDSQELLAKAVKKSLVSKLKTLSRDSDRSLAAFERFEKEAKTVETTEPIVLGELIKVEILKSKRAYFQSTEENNLEQAQKEGENDINLSEKEKITTNDHNNDAGELINVKIKPTCFEEVLQENGTGPVHIETMKDISITENQENPAGELIHVKIPKEKKTYFDKTETENIEVKKEMEDFSDHVPKVGDMVLKERKRYFADDEVSDRKSIDSVDIKNIVVKVTEKLVNQDLPEVYSNIKMLKNKRVFFDDISQSTEPATSKMAEITNNSVLQADIRSPSIVKEEVPNDYEPSTITKLLGVSRTSNVVLPSKKNKLVEKMCDSLDIFDESPLSENADEIKTDDTEYVDVIQESMKRISLTAESKVNDVQISDEENKIKNPQDYNIKPVVKISKILENTKGDNTTDEFENIYKDVTTTRATEFDLLVSQELNNTDLLAEEKQQEIVLSTMDISNAKYHLRHNNQPQTGNKIDESKPNEDDVTKNSKTDEPKQVKYNLRHKINLESDEKQEDSDKATKSTVKSKRSLRLRRRKHIDYDDVSKENPAEKLKDIANLQKEFSDVTLDIPAVQKSVKDIESPKRNAEVDENDEPVCGIQSCPSKSLTRSRRKLFTPRAEPLEESLSQAGDSNEPVRVPRPSYHRARARRKL